MVFDENIEIEDGVFKMFDPFVGESCTVSIYLAHAQLQWQTCAVAVTSSR